MTMICAISGLLWVLNCNNCKYFFVNGKAALFHFFFAFKITTTGYWPNEDPRKEFLVLIMKTGSFPSSEKIRDYKSLNLRILVSVFEACRTEQWWQEFFILSFFDKFVVVIGFSKKFQKLVMSIAWRKCRGIDAEMIRF